MFFWFSKYVHYVLFKWVPIILNMFSDFTYIYIFMCNMIVYGVLLCLLWFSMRFYYFITIFYSFYYFITMFYGNYYIVAMIVYEFPLLLLCVQCISAFCYVFLFCSIMCTMIYIVSINFDIHKYKQIYTILHNFA